MMALVAETGFISRLNQKSDADYNRRENTMRTIRTKVYKFNELSEQAKDTAVMELSDINVMDDFYVETNMEDAKEIGLVIKTLDDNSPNKGYFIGTAQECANAILQNHGINCATYKSAQYFIKQIDELYPDMDGDEIEEEINHLEEEFLNDILEDYRIMLNKEYEYLTSKEAIIETIEANEYDFTKDGKLFHS